jgi:hypothetical protein
MHPCRARFRFARQRHCKSVEEGQSSKKWPQTKMKMLRRNSDPITIPIVRQFEREMPMLSGRIQMELSGDRLATDGSRHSGELPRLGDVEPG